MDRDDEMLGRIDPKPARRYTAVGGLGLLGTILIYLAAAHPPAELGWLAFLLVLGAGSLWLAWRLWGVSAVPLILTRAALREEGPGGRVICAIDNVASVDRGFFAFKPANGFLVRLKTPAGRVYAPGLWWRAGRTVMVGGVTSGAQAKSVADMMKLLLAERDGVI